MKSWSVSCVLVYIFYAGLADGLSFWLQNFQPTAWDLEKSLEEVVGWAGLELVGRHRPHTTEKRAHHRLPLQRPVASAIDASILAATSLLSLLRFGPVYHAVFLVLDCSSLLSD